MKREDEYHYYLRKEAEFWGKMAEIRARQGIPDTMDYRHATKGIIKRSELGWGDCIQDRRLELRTPFGKAKKAFLDEFEGFQGKNVLDLGCGAGWLALELARRDAHVCAIDCSLQGMLVAKAYQKSLAENSWSRINWTVGDMNNLPIRNDAQFDLVTSWDALHHVKEIGSLLSRLSKVLKPDGRLMICERVQGGEQNLSQKAGLVVKSIVNLFFPMVIKYSTRANSFRSMVSLILRRLTKKKGQETENYTLVSEPENFFSPFEDVTGTEMIRYIEEYFSIERFLSYRAFSDDIERSLHFGEKFDSLRNAVVMLISWLDYCFIKTKVLPGQIILLYCKKK